MYGAVITIVIAGLCTAREITFPPISGFQFPLVAESQDFDISQPIFAGLTTFANLPYVHCLSAEQEEIEAYDIAILGAPFDTVGSTLNVGKPVGWLGKHILPCNCANKVRSSAYISPIIILYK